MDEHRIDVALTGSQKALALPTGLGILCASPKALEAHARNPSPRGYFDWGEYLRSYEAGTYSPYTPAVQMLYGLRASLDLILEVEGLENVVARHERLAKATRCCTFPSLSLCNLLDVVDRCVRFSRCLEFRIIDQFS